MKSILALLASIVGAVTLLIGGIAVASSYLAEPEPHKFDNLETAMLWSNRPVRVDREAQSYERLPALKVASRAESPERGGWKIVETQPEQANVLDPGVDHAAVTGSVGGTPAEASLEAHLEWCRARYSSYRAEDNTYQPYNGRRRHCVSRHAAMISASSDAGLSAQAANFRDPAHTEWCQRRYRSYRSEDNSYQSFSGGRRQCLSPFG